MESIWEIGRSEGVLHQKFGWLVDGLDYLTAGINLLAILLLATGVVRFVLSGARAEISRDGAARLRAINRERMELGRYILAGLELLIVADIIHTALSVALADLLYLGLLVLIRAAISFFLDRELGGLREEVGEGEPEAEGRP